MFESNARIEIAKILLSHGLLKISCMNEVLLEFVNYESNIFNTLGNLSSKYINSVKEYVLEQNDLVVENDKIRFYYENFFLSNSLISDYCNKIIKLSNNNSIMTQLRFKGLDLKKPFIEILFTNFEINNNNIEEICSYISKNYNTVPNTCLRFFNKSNIVNLERNCPIDKFLYANYYTSPLPTYINSKRVYLEIPTDVTSFYNEYLYEYNTVNKEFTTPLSIEMLQKLIIKKSFFLIKKGNNVIGSIAANEKYVGSIMGYEIVDEIIYQKYRGNSFAKEAQNLLINKLISDKSEALVLGTIHPGNIASIKTAESNNRIRLGAWHFISN